MKILHIIDTLEFGGAQTVVKGIFEGQTADQELYLFVLRDSFRNTIINHKNIYIFPSKRKYSLGPLTALIQFIRHENIKLFHCHLFRSQVFGWILKRIYYRNSILVFHEHGRVFTHNPLYFIFLRFTSSRTNLYLAISRATKRNLMQKARIAECKIKVLYNFVDLEKYNLDNRKDNYQVKSLPGLGDENFIVGFAGRLIARKGWRTIILAAEISRDKIPGIRYLIAGDGKEKNKLVKLIDQKGLKDKVIYFGYISDMVAFYALLDCFVIPSHWEPMGLTEIEAQAMGIPVIASDVEALNEIIQDKENGLLFTANDQNKLFEAIRLLSVNKALRKKIVKNGFETVKNYSVKKYITNLNIIYDEILTGKQTIQSRL